MATNIDPSLKRKYTGEETEAAKRPGEDLTFGPVFDVTYGAQKLQVHKKTICPRSRLFRDENISNTDKQSITLTSIGGFDDSRGFKLYLHFIYTNQPATLHELVQAWDKEINASSERHLHNADLAFIYCNLWALGQYLGDGAFANAAMAWLLEEVTPKDVTSMLGYYGVPSVFKKGEVMEQEGALWRWAVDSIASAQGNDFGEMWPEVDKCKKLSGAVKSKLIECRGGKLEAPTTADRKEYMVSEDFGK